MSSDLNFDLSAQAAPYEKPAERAPEALREDAPAAGSGGEAPDFVHLHVHSQYSMLDGATRIASVSDKKTKKLLAKGLVQKAKELGMRAVALTDHGNMFGAKLFYDTCRAERSSRSSAARCTSRGARASTRGRIFPRARTKSSTVRATT